MKHPNTSAKIAAIVLMTAIATLASTLVFAAEPSTGGDSETSGITDGLSDSSSNRMHKKLGAYMSLLGDPSPTLVGVNAAYNVTDYMRVNAGFGHVSASLGDESASLTTVGAGAKFFVPGWNFTPVLGANLAYAAFSGDTSVGGLTSTGLNPYLSVGFDWQARSGFNMGLAMNISLAGADSNPCLNLGWFF